MKCLFCGGKADLLCDSWIGWERKRDTPDGENVAKLPSYTVPIKYRVVHTCDAPLCRACASQAGGMFVRLRNRPGFYESIDYCPGHDSGDRRTEITGLQAEAWRRKWRLAVSLHRVRGTVPSPKQFNLFGDAP